MPASICTLVVFATGLIWANGDTINNSSQLSSIVENLLENHNSRMRPDADSGEPLDIYVNLYVTEIYRISETDMEFSMTFFVRQRWKDGRLRYDKHGGHNRSFTLNYNHFNKVWTPDLFIRNLKSGQLHDITVPNRLLRLYPDGTLLFSQRLSVTLACDMYLERYPMDNQTCHINMGSYAYTTEDIILKWDDTIEHPVVVNSKISFPKFDFSGVQPRECKVQTSTGGYPCIEAFFYLERRMKSYVLYIYLPSLLVVVLSWVSFWIDLQAVPARISLGILTILTVTTQSVGVNRDLPSVSFTKAIDVWMVSCLVFVFAAFLEYSVVNVLARKQRPSTAKDLYTALQLVHPRKEQSDSASVRRSPSQHLDGSGGSMDLRQRLDNNSQHSATCCQNRGEQTVAYAAPPRRNSKTSNALMVDIVSRVLFPILFALFNVIYWPFYYWDWVSVLRQR